MPVSGRTGVLLKLGASSATVRYDGTVEKAIGDARFAAPRPPVTLSLGTDVVIVSDVLPFPAP